MILEKNAIIAAIKARVMEIASMLGSDASDLQPDEILPATGAVDSAGLLELIAWLESAYALRIAAQEFTIDNLGSLNLMADFVLRRKGLL
jgi:acyl carrier protein